MGSRVSLLAGGVIPESVCRWDLNKGVDGREEVLAGVSGRVLVSDGSDSVTWNLKSYKIIKAVTKLENLFDLKNIYIL